MSCVFCQIINKDIPADIVFENERVIAFKDINPKAEVHLLIVPKKHIESVNDLEGQDGELIAEMIFTCRDIARDQKIESSYKLLFNVGRGGGQIIDHLHLHLMGYKNKS